MYEHRLVLGVADPTRQQKSKWTAAQSEQLRGASLVIFNDNDAAGYAHADEAARLSIGIAARVRRLDLKPHWPNMPEKADISDWLPLGHTREELDALMAGAADYEARGIQNGRAEADPPLPLVPDVGTSPPFPIDSLDGVLGAAADAISTKVQLPKEIVAQGVMAVGSLVAQIFADAQLPYGQTRPLSCYFMTIAGRSDRKSAADHEALRSIRQYERELSAKYNDDITAWRAKHGAWEAEQRRRKRRKRISPRASN
jgi:hypothetical protein